VTALYPLEGGVDVRPTVDVDCVLDLSTTADYHAFVSRLRARDFKEYTDENARDARAVRGRFSGHFEGHAEGQARADLVLDWLASLRTRKGRVDARAE
jgi:hypothetical protein